MTLNTKNSGISLVLVAVLLLVMGSAAGVMLAGKERAAVWNPRTDSKTDLNAVKDALVAYQRQFHRLPCVAPRDASAASGVELADCSTGGSANAHGTVRLDLTGAGTTFLRIGAVPYRTLAMPITAGEDRWGNRLLYAHIEHLTDPFQFTTGTGSISVQDSAAVAIENQAAFVVLSHGADGKGAFTAKGGLRAKPCNSAVGLDVENCNDTNGVFTVADVQAIAGADYFDDLVVWDRVDTTAQSQNRPCLRAAAGDASWTGGCTNNNWVDMLHGVGGQSVNNTNNATHVGSATLACVNGTLEYSDVVCNQHCSAAPQSWLGDCGGNVAFVEHGSTSAAVPNTNPGFTGSATFSCSNGTFSVASSSCDVACAGGGTATERWWSAGSSYQGTYGAPDCGTCVRVETARSWSECESEGASYCNELVMNVTMNCQASCPGGTTWDAARGYCRATSCLTGATNPTGACNTCPDGYHLYRRDFATSCPSGFTGTALVTQQRANCSAGWTTIGTNTSGCTPSAPANCAAAARSWTVGAHTCNATVPATNHGNNGTANDATAPTTGTASFSCNDGTLAATPNAGATCTAASGTWSTPSVSCYYNTPCPAFAPAVTGGPDPVPGAACSPIGATHVSQFGVCGPGACFPGIPSCHGVTCGGPVRGIFTCE